MRTDLYTKIVLTVIAACLLVIALRDAPSPASATPLTDVRIVEIKHGYGSWDAVRTEPNK